MMNNPYSEIFCVTKNDCISAIDGSLPDLLGTYTIVKWMEIVSAKNINQQIDNQHISVGEKISIEHSGMVKNGDKVEIISIIKTFQRRNVSFIIEANNQGKIIAKARHDRIVIPIKLISRLLK